MVAQPGLESRHRKIADLIIIKLAPSMRIDTGSDQLPSGHEPSDRLWE
jgi:hypothetical protein